MTPPGSDDAPKAEGAVVITALLVDGHVHYHSCFGVRDFLEAARSNFQAARREVGDPDAMGCLMFSESAWSHHFRAFADGLIERATRDWTVEATDEACSVVARKDGNAELLLIAGRQIVTAERLEVLALATLQEYPDALPIGEAIDLALSTGAVTVLPWGFGKWTGGRGRIVRHILSSPVADELCVGDNGGRPAAGPEPALFALARETGVPILPGSDPLPLPAEVRKPGRCGFLLQGPVDLHAPAAGIREMVSSRAQPRRYGRLERLATFVHRQAALRLRRNDDRPTGSKPRAEGPG
jgi:hypothetical protein